MLSDSFLPEIREKFIANVRNIMQALSECLALSCSLHNFTLRNQTNHIMKKNADKGKSEGGNSEFHTRRKFSKNSEIEAYLSTHYEFRYNTVLGRTEYRSKNDAHFSKVGRYEINTLRRELDNDIGITTTSDNLYSIIESSFSPRINPIQEYFKNLPSVDISSSSSFSLKAIPHLASFVASVNGNDFLTDPTGSRRFLPFEVLSIDIERAKAISMNNVYAEAKALLKLGFRYWFDDDEIAELYRESEDFQVQTAEMELLLRCFEKPTEDESYSLMTTTEILTYLGIYTHQPLVAKRMGEALKKAGYIKVSKRRNGGSPIYVYKIRKILPCPLLQTCSSQM